MCSFLGKEKGFTFFSSNRIILYIEKWGISKILNQSMMGHGTPLMQCVIQTLLSPNNFAKCYLFCRGSLSSLIFFFFNWLQRNNNKKSLKSEFILIREVVSWEIKIGRRKTFPILNCATAEKNKNTIWLWSILSIIVVSFILYMQALVFLVVYF